MTLRAHVIDEVTIRSRQETLALRLPVKALVVLAILILLLIFTIALSLTIGSFPMNIADVFRVVMGDSSNRQMFLVVWEFRMPRTLVAAMVGAMLALSGASLQQITRNALADPSLVGISQGAGLAVVALTVLWPDALAFWRPWAALAGSLLVAMLILSLSVNKQGGSSIRFILMGIGVAAFISALTTVLLTYGRIEQAAAALTWLSGSVNSVNWTDVQLSSLSMLILLPLLLMLSRLIAVQQMGDAIAQGLGASISRLRVLTISIAVALAAFATAIAGPMAFVGLIAPHAARRLAHAGFALRLLITACLGALLVTVADLLGRALFAPVQIPAGLVTAIIGVPFFVYLLFKSGRSSTYR